MTSKEVNFIADLITYRPISCIVRIFFISLIGWLCLFMTASVADAYEFHLHMPYVSYSLGFVIITELNVLFNHIIIKYGPQKMKEYMITMHFLLNVGLSIILIMLMLPLIEGNDILNNPIVVLSIIFTSLFIVFIILGITLLRLLQTSIKDRQELTALREAQKASEYQSLVEQVNPHFLFNNLSVLKSLIVYDKDKAVTFTQNFTDIYRYVLQSKDKPTIRLTEELDFAQAYIALHKERIGEGLHVEFNISQESQGKSILTMGLQLLIENALKHNIATKTAPLTITISSTEDSLTVKNNVNKKDVPFSTKKGLENIAQRYHLLTDKDVVIDKSDTEFSVTLPLI